MSNRGCLILSWFLIQMSTGAWVEASCSSMDSYRRVFAACFTGRAGPGTLLPQQDSFSRFSGFMTNWNLGPLPDSYQGPAFSPEGLESPPAESMLPPYLWGARGQICDGVYNRVTQPTEYLNCVERLNRDLANPAFNPIYDDQRGYWVSQGHNCHDAVEDVGTCILNAASRMPADCPLDARVVVWDSESDILKSVGNVYHSQLLVKRMVRGVEGGAHMAVCLAEAQIRNPSGDVFPPCCTESIGLFEGGTLQEYREAFWNCSNIVVSPGHYFMHVYAIPSFREQRGIGPTDVLNGYRRDSGLRALEARSVNWTNSRPASPKIKGMALDRLGNTLMVNLE